MSHLDSPRLQRLGPADIALLADMNTLFATAFGDDRSYREARPSEGYLARVLASDEVVALVARDGDGAVIGALVAYELRKLERERSEMYLYDLAVAAPHRRRGVATALIAELRRIAAARGAWVVFVQADHGDDPAIALYTRLGTREDVLHFDIPVP